MCKGLSAGDFESMSLPNRDGEWSVVKVDACMVSILAALNGAGIHTLNSCCAHGRNPGDIFLADGRMLRVYESRAVWEEEGESAGWLSPPSTDGKEGE